MAAEAVVIFLYRRRTGRGLSGADLLSVLLPGACLVLALRSALISGDVPAIAAFLSAAMVSHVLDLRRRWRRSVGARSPQVKFEDNESCVSTPVKK